MQIDIKLENDFGYNSRLLEDLETSMREFLSEVKIHSVDSSGNHWVKVSYDLSETLVKLGKTETTEALIRGFVVGFLEANRITCV